MKVILVSDSHGFTDNIIEAIEKEPDCDTIFFLGDGISDIEKCIVHYPQKKFFVLRVITIIGIKSMISLHINILRETLLYTPTGIRLTLDELYRT